jgi:hypothetical protein
MRACAHACVSIEFFFFRVEMKGGREGGREIGWDDDVRGLRVDDALAPPRRLAR